MMVAIQYRMVASYVGDLSLKVVLRPERNRRRASLKCAYTSIPNEISSQNMSYAYKGHPAVTRLIAGFLMDWHRQQSGLANGNYENIPT